MNTFSKLQISTPNFLNYSKHLWTYWPLTFKIHFLIKKRKTINIFEKVKYIAKIKRLLVCKKLYSLNLKMFLIMYKILVNSPLNYYISLIETSLKILNSCLSWKAKFNSIRAQNALYFRKTIHKISFERLLFWLLQ